MTTLIDDYEIVDILTEFELNAKCQQLINELTKLILESIKDRNSIEINDKIDNVIAQIKELLQFNFENFQSIQ